MQRSCCGTSVPDCSAKVQRRAPVTLNRFLCVESLCVESHRSYKPTSLFVRCDAFEPLFRTLQRNKRWSICAHSHLTPLQSRFAFPVSARAARASDYDLPISVCGSCCSWRSVHPVMVPNAFLPVSHGTGGLHERATPTVGSLHAARSTQRTSSLSAREDRPLFGSAAGTGRAFRPAISPPC